jgi:diguanylate cyclase (GGDEF)-like protein
MTTRPGKQADEEIPQDKKAYEQEIQHLFFTDPLTGLNNRQALCRDFARHLPCPGFLELALINIDRFKDINDGLGHHTGDLVLMEIGRYLDEIADSRQCRAYRLAGDEFVFLAAECEIDAACRELLAAASMPVSIKNHFIKLNLSIGVARSPDHGDTFEALIQCANTAMQQAKQKDSGRIHYFKAELLPYLEAQALLTGLEESLAQHELSYVFQPIFDLKQGEIIGYEALARWQHEGHSISPEVFISLADKTGQIHRIQDYLFDHLAKRLDALGDTAYLTLNISASQLASDQLLIAVKRFLSETGFSPARLELELTEHSLLPANDETVNRMKQLKALGIKFVLDNFGAGFSGLSYLRDFPIDKVKIDGSFITDIHHDQKSLGVILSIMNLARHLDIGVVAKGIENLSQADLMRKLGCQSGQGYLYSKWAGASSCAGN